METGRPNATKAPSGKQRDAVCTVGPAGLLIGAAVDLSFLRALAQARPVHHCDKTVMPAPFIFMKDWNSIALSGFAIR